MKSTINNKVILFSILFGGLCTSLFSQTNEKIEKVKPIEISKLTSLEKEKSACIKGNKIYRFVDFSHVVDSIPNKEEANSSVFNIIRKREVSRLASRSLYDMVMIIK